MPDAPRTPRAKWKVTLSWITGCVTDPHTKWSSAARIVGMIAAITLCAYVIICALTKQKPDAVVCSVLSGLSSLALALRAKSTQTSGIPIPQRLEDRVRVMESVQPPEVPRG